MSELAMFQMIDGGLPEDAAEAAMRLFMFRATVDGHRTFVVASTDGMMLPKAAIPRAYRLGTWRRGGPFRR